MINITQGNDFSLKITFTRNGAQFSFSTVNTVCLVSSVSRRRPLVFNANPDGSLIADASASIPVGVYGIEVIGTEDTALRRTMFRNCVKITYDTEQGDGPIAFQADPYDIAITVELQNKVAQQPDVTQKNENIQVGDFLLLAEPDPDTTYRVFQLPGDPGEHPVSIFRGDSIVAGLSREQLSDLPVPFADRFARQGCMTMFGIDDPDRLTYRVLRGDADPDKFPSELPIMSFDEFRFFNPALADRLLDAYKFTGLSYLRSIVIPDGVTSIGNNAFGGCCSLQSVVIPDGVTTISREAFNACTSLQSIVIPDGVTSIGKNAFLFCYALRSITIPESVTTIGDSAFNSCTSLRSITIPESVTTIGGSAFSGCTSLQSITIPESVTTIGRNAFSCCTSLQSITIPESVTTIGESAFAECSSLQSITIPKGVTAMGVDAFCECHSLQSITISEGVTTIGCAFSQCESLQSVVIPESVTTIGDHAFNFSRAIQITLLTRTVSPDLGFDRIYDSIYVPADLVDAYKVDAVWSRFAEQIIAIPGEASEQS